MSAIENNEDLLYSIAELKYINNRRSNAKQILINIQNLKMCILWVQLYTYLFDIKLQDIYIYIQKE